MRDVLKDALTTGEPGPKVVIAASECMLNRQRREKPVMRKAMAEGRRVVKQVFGVDEDVCTGDHACMRISGCPSLTLKDTGDPLRDDPVATVDRSCVARGHCGEVAQAAILCPSFYRADTIHNANLWDRFRASVRASLIGYLQRRRASARALEVPASRAGTP